MPQRKATIPAPKAGWSIEEHRLAVGFSKNFYYTLPPELRPRSVRIGAKKIVVTESPADYLARLEREQRATV